MGFAGHSSIFECKDKRMSNIIKILTLLTLLLVCVPTESYAQDKGTRKERKMERKKAKAREKEKKKKDKEARKAEKEAFKRYYSIQCKHVRKKLKKQKKQANKKNKKRWHD